MAEQPEIKSLSFEEALAELEEIVRKLEQGDVALEDSIGLYERGERLKQHCERRLRQAEAKVEKIRLSGSGEAEGTEPLDRE